MMPSSLNWLGIAAIIAMCLGIWLCLNAHGSTHDRMKRRLKDTIEAGATTGGAGSAARTSAGLAARLSRALQALGGIVPLFNAAQRAEMSHKLTSAGYRQANALPVLMGLAAGSAVLLAALAAVLLWPMLADKMPLRMACLLGGGYLGLLLPRLVVDRLVKRRQKAIERNFPDALDLLVVCTNSGLGLNAALHRVAHELAFLAPELADELSLTAAQLQLSGDTAEVLHQLADRIGLASTRSLVSTLIQSRRFGTPIGQALRVLSRGERTARLMRTEEAAAKLAAKITVPMMIFILPTVLIVAAGPSVLHLMEMFAK